MEQKEFGGLLRGIASMRQEPLPGMDEYLAGNRMDQYETRFREIFEAAMLLYRRKTADYNASWRKHGADGIFTRLCDKIERLEALYWERDTNEAQVKDESIRDTMTDMIPYVLMLVYCYERGEFRRGQA